MLAIETILFDGGISTNWKSVYAVIRDGALLSTFGVLLTALILGLFSGTVSSSIRPA